MKKLFNLFGLVLLAAMLITGCKKEAAWEEDVTEDTTEVVLSNGTWEYTSSLTVEGDYKKIYLDDMEPEEVAALPPAYRDLTGRAAVTWKDINTLKIDGDNVTLKGGKEIYAIKFPDGADKTILENTVKAQKESLPAGQDVSLSGTTITFTTTYSEADLANISVSKENILAKFSGQTVKTNKKHTKYMLTASIEQNGSKLSTKVTLSKK